MNLPGGHPNEKGVLCSMKLNKDDSSRTIQAVLLHDDPRLIDEGLRQVEAAGLFALMCCRLIWPVRCDIIGVSDTLFRLRPASIIAAQV